jgi:hypothetical protein
MVMDMQYRTYDASMRRENMEKACCSDDGTRVRRDTRPEVSLKYEVHERKDVLIESKTHAFLRHGAGDGGTLHLTLRVNDNTGVVLRGV